MAIYSSGNTIAVSADFTLRELPRLLAAMHTTVNSKGYSEFLLDFADCTAAYAGPMLGAVAHAQFYWSQGVDVALTLPKDERLARLFRNANWAHLIDFRSYEPSKFSGTSQVPAIKYQNGTEQHAAVDQVLDILFGALADLSRNDLRALEWSLNEVSDNVLNHAQSKVGGFLQVTNASRAKRVEFAVADPGIGIPNSLRSSRVDIRSDQEALDQAVREGVTRSSEVGQGNGLFGTLRIAQIGSGRLNILSGYASLDFNPQAGLHIGSQSIPFSGTLVVANIPYAQPVDLGEAFQFQGRKHVPVDYVDMHFDVDETNRPILQLAKESAGFGSRDAGRIARNKVLNLQKLSEGDQVVIDLGGVPLISSSFADELFGMLFLSLGPIQFSQTLTLINVDPLVRSLIDRAILQRAKQ